MVCEVGLRWGSRRAKMLRGKQTSSTGPSRHASALLLGGSRGAPFLSLIPWGHPVVEHRGLRRGRGRVQWNRGRGKQRNEGRSLIGRECGELGQQRGEIHGRTVGGFRRYSRRVVQRGVQRERRSVRTPWNFRLFFGMPIAWGARGRGFKSPPVRLGETAEKSAVSFVFGLILVRLPIGTNWYHDLVVSHCEQHHLFEGCVPIIRTLAHATAAVSRLLAGHVHREIAAQFHLVIFADGAVLQHRVTPGGERIGES